MVVDGYGVKVELKRRFGPAILIFVKETPDQIKEENLDKISMNRPRYRAIYNVPNSAEADLTPDELDCILPKEVVSCTRGYFSGGARLGCHGVLSRVLSSLSVFAFIKQLYGLQNVRAL